MLEGFTTFTVIPFLASSSAKELDSATTAALAAAYADIFASPNARSAPTAPKLMIRPQRAFRLCASAAQHTYQTLSRLAVKMPTQLSSEHSASARQRKS